MMSWVTWWSAHAWGTAVGSGAASLTHSCEVRPIVKVSEVRGCNGARVWQERINEVCVSFLQISVLLTAWPTRWTRNSPNATTRATWWTAPATDRDVDAGSATPSVCLWLFRELKHTYLIWPLVTWLDFVCFVFCNRSVSGTTNQNFLPDRRDVGQDHPQHPLPLLLLW